MKKMLQVGDSLLDPNTKEERWKIQRIVRGGMGVVYLVYDNEAEKPFAVKTFQDEVIVHNPALAERFKREALAWLRLGKHPNIARAEFLQVIEGKPYLFLEFVRGGDLKRWCSLNPSHLDTPTILRFALQFCDGMTFALDHGIEAHRDIKPDNCLIDVDGTLKITDFGLAKALNDFRPEDLVTPSSPLASLHTLWLRAINALHRPKRGQDKRAPNAMDSDYEMTDFHRSLLMNYNKVDNSFSSEAVDEAIGTLAYTAPEQFDHPDRASVRSDIYSFAVMLFEMLVGHPPFRVGARASADRYALYRRVHQKQLPPLELLDRFPLSLRVLLGSCLAKKPESRPDNFAQIRECIENIYEEVTGEKAPPPAHSEALSASDWHNRGSSLSALNQPQEALSCFEQSLKLDPDSALSHYSRGNILIQLGRYDEALAQLETAIKMNPNFSFAHYKKAEVLDEMGRYEEMLPIFDQVLALGDVPPSQPIYAQGLTFIKLERNDEALACFDRCVKLAPGDAVAWCDRGNALSRLGRADEAVESYRRSLQLEPSRKITQSNMASLLAETGQHEEVVEFCDSVLGQDDQFLAALYMKATALGRLGRHEEALVIYDRMLSINQHRAELWCDKGIVLNKLGRNEESLQCQAQAIKEDPRFEKAWTAKGDVLRQLGRAREAFKCYQKCIRINSANAQAVYMTGVLWFENPAFYGVHAALRWFEKAKELGYTPEDVDHAIKRCREEIERMGTSTK